MFYSLLFFFCFRYHWRIIIKKFNSFVCMPILYSAFFCSFRLFLLLPFFISPIFHLNLIWSFFASSSFILLFFILSIRSKALSYSWNVSSGVLPLYVYTKSSRLTFLSNSIVSLSLLSASSLNIYFCFEINGLSSSS